jgi:phospholipid/cholesterol/gamma-HCH transport system permease protein
MNGRINNLLASCGRYFLLLKDTFLAAIRSGVSGREVARQMVLIGVQSLPIVLLTALFTGMVLALQTAYGLVRFGAKNYVGNITGLGFVRELGPVLTAIVVCGRVGAGVAAELASMVVTEQVDAMRALGADPKVKLVAPRIIAGLTVTPLLTILANVVGMYGALLIAVYELNIAPFLFGRGLLYTLVIKDLFDGIIKSAVFGVLVVSIACHKGLSARGGTEGVGRTTTSAVVTGCIVIFVVDFFLTKLLLLF